MGFISFEQKAAEIAKEYGIHGVFRRTPRIHCWTGSEFIVGQVLKMPSVVDFVSFGV
jgi:hypothetical protein